jgi:hypothetical protein
MSQDGRRTCLCGEPIYRPLRGPDTQLDSYNVHACPPSPLGTFQECTCGDLVKLTAGVKMNLDGSGFHSHQTQTPARAPQKPKSRSNPSPRSRDTSEPPSSPPAPAERASAPVRAGLL